MVVGLLTPVYAFGKCIWLAVGCIFIIAVIVLTLKFYFYDHNRIMLEIYHVRKQNGVFQHFIKSIIIVYKVFLSQSIANSEMPKGANAKFLVTLLMVLGLIITSLYSSGYTSIMTIPRYENAIDTVQDLANSNLYWAGDDYSWIESIQGYEEPEYRKVVELFILADENQMRIYSETKNFGFAMERLSAKTYSIGNFIPRDTIKYYHIMKDDIYWLHCVMMVRKSSVLLPVLDQFFLNAHAGGLFTKLHEMAIDACLDFYVHTVLQHPQNDHNVVKLNWSHVVAPFTILLFGYIISSVVFIIEIFLYKSSRRNIKMES